MRWRLKPPASQLFTQPFILAEIKENIKAPRYWPFVRGIHRGPVNSPHKWPVTRKMFPFDDVIMAYTCTSKYQAYQAKFLTDRYPDRLYLDRIDIPGCYATRQT